MWNPKEAYKELLNDGMSEEHALNEVVAAFHLIYGGDYQEVRDSLKKLLAKV